LIEPGEGSTVAVVAVSHSGGDPFSFFEVARALREAGPNVALYAVKLPSRPAEGPEEMLREVDQITTEVCDELAGLQIPVIVYAQCNGSALGVSITQRLEHLERPALAFIVGGALFRTFVMPEDRRSDAEVVDFLVSIGSVLPNDPAERAFFLSDFKYDCAMASAFYNRCIAQGARLERTTAAVFCIAGTNDPVIPDYPVQVSNWRRLSDRVTLIEYEGQGHYLLRDCPERVAATIRKVAEGVTADAAHTPHARARAVATQAV
jgi:surfactin synthase thioesterase subunit